MLIGVAATAVDVGVLIQQWEVRVIVVEAGILPAGLFVAVVTLFAQLTIVLVTLFVTVDTLVGGFTKAMRRLMAIATGGRPVFALKWIIGKVMVKRGVSQLDNVGVSAHMVRMAGFTFNVFAVFHPPVESSSLFDIFGDILMIVAGQTAIALFGLIKRFMAAIALGFELRVAIDHFTGHEDSFEDIGFSRHTEA